MKEKPQIDDFANRDNNKHSDLTHLKFAAHVVQQNNKRSDYFKGLTFGDPVWDILLDIYVSEKTNQPTTTEAISSRQKKPNSLCQRCINYLLDNNAIYENRNRYTATEFQYLASDETKQQIAAWLDNCLALAP
ncbi:hypothetical protein GCM10009096_06790 [Parasphingorhabdus litoris]|uniref:MarR family transcriptional regulator n=1 Tax=Parasphingorhabdus litoris TaxID=394733 RepID=A0ABP3K2H1_9SPHN|nr:hypothetical protein [Parasphingorhabdus litoris]